MEKNEKKPEMEMLVLDPTKAHLAVHKLFFMVQTIGVAGTEIANKIKAGDVDGALALAEGMEGYLPHLFVKTIKEYMIPKDMLEFAEGQAKELLKASGIYDELFGPGKKETTH